MIQTIAWNCYIRILLVEWQSLAIEIGEGLVGFHCEAATIEIQDARFELVEWELQVDHRARGFEMGHRGLGVDDATSRSDDGTWNPNGEDVFLFDFLKCCFADVVYDFLKAASLGRLHDEIGIDEVSVESFGEEYAHGAFSGAGHADEYDVI